MLLLAQIFLYIAAFGFSDLLVAYTCKKDLRCKILYYLFFGVVGFGLLLNIESFS
jgi:hypothetical protein